MIIFDKQRPYISVILIQLVTLALSISLSTSRLHDPQSLSSLLNTYKNTTHALYKPSSPSSSSSSPLTVSSEIPSVQKTNELAHLSSLVYYLKRLNSHNCTPFDDTLEWYSEAFSFDTDGASYHCHLYEVDKEDTQVLVVSRTIDSGGSSAMGNNNNNEDHDDDVGNYVAVVYAGTDDFRTALKDVHTAKGPYGPAVNGTYPFSPSDSVRVHKGFNNAVFDDGLMDRVLETVQGVMMGGQMEGDGFVARREILTAGHSLGGAGSVLCAVALSSYFEEDMVTSVSFGCPKIGNKGWKDFVDSIPNVAVWRLVNLLDLVPRLPAINYRHVGHTVQLGRKDTRAYWLHEGDTSLGYLGVPHGWKSIAYALTPVATYEHFIGRYIIYLKQKSIPNKDRYYIDKFESVNDLMAEADDEDYNEVYFSDEEKTRIVEEYGRKYLELKRGEYGKSNDYGFEMRFGDQYVESANATLEIM
jgi:hypothetical protein